MTNKRLSDEELLAQVKAMAPEPPPRTTAAVAETPNVEIPTQTAAAILAGFEALIARVDRGEEGAAGLMATVLADHGLMLKKNLNPENKLHPDINYQNPKGERDFPRPPLTRLCYWLGIALEQPALTWEEIDLLNSITMSLELKEKSWKVVLLRDGSGRETLHISTPYRSRDDLNIEGGWQRVLRDLLATGTRPETSELLRESSDKMAEQIATLTARLNELAPTPAP
jgi:hypothetical protein